jgi:PQQ-dependent dehydrogenase (methanol/ethanol family)
MLLATAAYGQSFTPVTDAMLQDPDPADWLMWRRTLDGWGYSPLAEIDRSNVGSLRMIWSRPMSSEGDNQGTPLVYDGVMYMANPNDLIEALDPLTGDQLWAYQRTWPEDLSIYLRFPGRSRNIAIYDDLIINTSGDSYVFAIDTAFGNLVWENRVLDYKINTSQRSSGPIIADGKVISGRNCYSEGGPEACVITAHDARTGQELWRTSTIPRPGEPGDETWGDVPFERRWHVGTWMVPSYDPELGLVYIGTSVTSPAPKYMLGSNDDQYLYHNSTLALDVDTGEIVWYYQHLVDHWDLDHPFERMLIDTAVAPDPDAVAWINPRIVPGEMRRVVTGIPGKTGVVYTLDRETGEFLWARETVEQNVIASINTESGAATVSPEKTFTAPDQEHLICPSTSGGKNYPAGTYSPLTGLMYYPLQNTCMMTRSIASEPDPDVLYAINNRLQITPGEQNIGTIQAISASTGETAWKYEERSGVLSLISTGGRLLFGGDVNGRFRAYDQDTGEILWEVNLGSPVNGYPATYEVDGRQYVAISTGGSGLVFGLGALTPELRTGSGNQLYVFALPR